MDNNYCSVDELQEILGWCTAMQPIWDKLTSGRNVLTSCDLMLDMKIYDSNGELLGKVDWCESGPAFYPSNGSDNG